MINILITFWVIFVSFFSIFFIGIPCAYLLTNGDNTDQKLLMLSTFLGIAVIVLFSQNLIYLSFTIETTFYWLYLIALISWIYLISKKKLYQLKQPFFLKLLLIVLLVYFVNAAGLIIRGVNAYVGQGWSDLRYYTYISEYLMHFPFNTHPFAAISHIPYALRAITFLNDRIGVFILQGFISASAFVDAKSASGPTVLLSCVLVAFALYKTAREFKLTQNLSLIVAMGAALPAIAYIHLDCFFSQALCVPFLLIWPWILAQAFRTYHWKNFLIAALILAAATAIYMEFYAIFILILVISVINASIQKRAHFLKPIAYGVGILCISHILNLGFIYYLCHAIVRIAAVKVYPGAFPLANSIAGWNSLWLGDLANFSSPLWNLSISIISLLLLIMAYSGILYAVIKRKDILSWSILILSVLPLPFLINITTYEYQFYKILLSICPVFFIGICLWYDRFSENIKKPVKNFLITLLILSVTATLTLTAKTGFDNSKYTIGNFHWFTSSSVVDLEQKLLSIKNKNVVIVLGDILHAEWFSYFARFNRVWIMDQPYDLPFIPTYSLPKDIPEKFYLLMPTSYMLFNSQLNKNIIWQAGELTLININKPAIIINPDTFDAKINSGFKFYSTANGTVQISLDISSATTRIALPLQVNVDGVRKRVIVAQRKQFSVNLPVKQGEHEVRIMPIE